MSTIHRNRRISENKDSMVSAKVTNAICEEYGITEQELYNVARTNTKERGWQNTHTGGE